MRASPFACVQKLLGISDEQLMRRIASDDDESAFTNLMGRWQAAIQHLCFRMTGDPHRAEDITQETFSRVYTHRKAYQAEHRFSTWLWRIALNLCYDELRSAQRREQLWSDPEDESRLPFLASPAPSPDGRAVQSEEGNLVRSALNDLPEHYRSVLVLRHYQDLKFHEIAEILEIPEGTVKSRLTEALNRMHRQLRSTMDNRVTASLPESRPNRKAIP